MKLDQNQTLLTKKNRDITFSTLVTTSMPTTAIACSFYSEVDDDDATIRRASFCGRTSAASTRNDGRGRGGYCADYTVALEKRRRQAFHVHILSLWWSATDRWKNSVCIVVIAEWSRCTKSDMNIADKTQNGRRFIQNTLDFTEHEEASFSRLHSTTRLPFKVGRTGQKTSPSLNRLLRKLSPGEEERLWCPTNWLI